MAENNPDKMTFGEHVTDLRKRVLISLVAISLFTGISLFFSKQIYHLLQRPLTLLLTNTSSFITLSPVEGWLVYFKIALFTSVLCSSPIWMYQIWAFASPGLYKKEKSKILIMGIASALLFCLGIVVCYFIILPQGFGYFVSILDKTGIVLMPQMSLYLSFIMRLLLAFGIVFEIPIIVIFLVYYKILSVQNLSKKRPYVILIAFILAAVITPPDVFTQIALAIPFIILFEVSLLVARLVCRKKGI